MNQKTQQQTPSHHTPSPQSPSHQENINEHEQSDSKMSHTSFSQKRNSKFTFPPAAPTYLGFMIFLQQSRHKSLPNS
jgi:hypothetical protein